MSFKTNQKLTKIKQLMLDWEIMCQPREVGDDEARVKVHKMVSKLGWGYEKIRALIDSGHGHQECYRAIYRILKRMLFIEKRKAEKIPQLLAEELIRAGFLENNKFPKADLKIVEQIIDKYIVLMSKISVKISQAVINNSVSKHYAKKRRKEINTWLAKLAARELERFLLPKNKEEVIVKSMYKYMVEQIEIIEGSVPQKDKKIQVYIATQRALWRPDDGILSYYLFKLQCPNWSSCNDDDLEAIAKKIFKIKENIDEQLNHSIKDKLRRLCSRHVVYFIILFEILNEIGAKGFAKLIKDQPALEEKITATVKNSYSKARRKIRKGMIKSTLYVLITKSIVIEYPISQGVVFGFWEFLAILFAGPIIMLLVGLSITQPPNKNTKKIIKVFRRMIFEDKIRTDPYKVRLVGRPLFMSLLFVLFYTTIFTSIISGIYWILGIYGFSAMTTSITLFFFSLISYFGFRLREIMREYVVLDSKENIIGFIFDFISIPILKLGQLLSDFIDKINISKPFMDYVIEPPYKAFVDFFEHWIIFLKEKKEELDQGGH
jgi:hypothetical protein